MMKKAILFLALVATMSMSAQKLSDDAVIALKTDNPTLLAQAVSITEFNTCFTVGKNKATLLDLATQLNAGDVFEYLMRQDVIEVNNSCADNTALERAIISNSDNMVGTLLKHGAKKTKEAKRLASTSKNKMIVSLMK